MKTIYKSLYKLYNTKHTNNFLVIIIWGEIPVPIPNTEVKPLSADNTRELPCLEDKLSPVFIYSSLAQSVERSAVKQIV